MERKDAAHPCNHLVKQLCTLQEATSKGHVKEEQKDKVGTEKRVSDWPAIPKNRRGDLQEFFSNKTQGIRASLSDYGKLHACKRTYPLHCIGPQYEVSSSSRRTLTAKCLDGAVVVHFLPTTGVTIDKCAIRCFVAHLHYTLGNSESLDALWDNCVEDDIKESNRAKRGKGPRRKAARQTSGLTSSEMLPTRPITTF